jgi:hypothetical protein
MSAIQQEMKVTFEDRGMTLRARLHDRLESAGRLRCTVHGKPVVAVTIHGFDNGWFDAIWTTCCPGLTQQAVAIVKARC